MKGRKVNRTIFACAARCNASALLKWGLKMGFGNGVSLWVLGFRSEGKYTIFV